MRRTLNMAITVGAFAALWAQAQPASADLVRHSDCNTSRTWKFTPPLGRAGTGTGSGTVSVSSASPTGTCAGARALPLVPWYGSVGSTTGSLTLHYTGNCEQARLIGDSSAGDPYSGTVDGATHVTLVGWGSGVIVHRLEHYLVLPAYTGCVGDTRGSETVSSKGVESSTVSY